MNQKILDALCDMGYEESIVFDSPDYDDAIVGVSDEGRVVYDYDEMVRILVERDGMDEIEAIDFIEYNSIRALPYVENAPIVVHMLRMEDDDQQTE